MVSKFVTDFETHCVILKIFRNVLIHLHFIQSNSTPTIPSSWRKKKNMFPNGSADTAKSSGSRLFELNSFMWDYGRMKAREISVSEACKMREARAQEGKKKRKITRNLHKGIQEKYSFTMDLAFNCEPSGSDSD